MAGFGGGSGAADSLNTVRRRHITTAVAGDATARMRAALFVEDRVSASADRHLAVIDCDVGWFQHDPRRPHRVWAVLLINAQIAAGLRAYFAVTPSLVLVLLLKVVQK